MSGREDCKVCCEYERSAERMRFVSLRAFFRVYVPYVAHVKTHAVKLS